MPNNTTEKLFESNSIALIGLDRKREKFGWTIYDELTLRGASLYAVNDNGGEVSGVTLYKSLSTLPQKPDAVVVLANSKKYPKILDDIIGANIPLVFFQYGTYNKIILEKIRAIGLNAGSGCAMMYLSNTGTVHKIHRFIHELFAMGAK